MAPPVLDPACAVGLPSAGIDWGVVGVMGAASFLVGLGSKLQQEAEAKTRSIRVPAGKMNAPARPPVTGENRCKECMGQRKVTCYVCEGVGRTNSRWLIILPKGENPVWCSYCRGTGSAPCGRCLGTGERPNRIGFRVD